MAGFPRAIISDPIWCLYDNLRGEVILKHPYWRGLHVPCPHCAKELHVDGYRAACCGFTFKTSFGEIHQCEPHGRHDKSSNRGGASIRPYRRDGAT